MVKLFGWGLLALIVVGVIASHGSKDKSGLDSATAASANIMLVESKSSCVSTGVTDAYTGDGRVLFTFVLRNIGDGDGDVSVTPVRHYSDGETNESAMDMMDIPVSAGSSERFNTGQLTYEAHAHDVVSCGLVLNGGDEIPIKATHI